MISIAVLVYIFISQNCSMRIIFIFSILNDNSFGRMKQLRSNHTMTSQNLIEFLRRSFNNKYG